MKKAVLWTLITGGIIMGLFGCSKKEDANQNLGWQEQISADTLSAEQFTCLYQQALQKKLPDTKIEITETLELKVYLGENKYICWLGNAWKECRDQPNIRVDTCNYYIDEFLTTAGDNHDPKENLDPDLVIPEIKCKEHLDGLPLQADGTHPVYSKPIVGDIYLTYVLRLDRGICFLSESDIEQVGLFNDKLHETAMSNLKRLATEIRVHGKQPFFIITSDGVSASSLLLFDSIWERQKDNVPGNIIACVPSKDFLLFTGSDSPEGLSELRKKAKEISEIDSYLISDVLLIREDNKWVIFEN